MQFPAKISIAETTIFCKPFPKNFYDFGEKLKYKAALKRQQVIKHHRDAITVEDMIKLPDIVIRMNTYARNADM